MTKTIKNTKTDTNINDTNIYDEWERVIQNIDAFIDVRKYTYETLNELYNLNLYDEELVIQFLYKYS
jgi:hypothetical protein